MMLQNQVSKRKNLPISIQTFSEIRDPKLNYYYVDKTEFVYDIIKSYKPVFLSRPRRFGKSLLLETFKELFEGNEELFKGLYIHDKWDWSKKHAVIKFDFSGGSYTTKEEITQILDHTIQNYEKSWNYQPYTTHLFSSRLRNLVEYIAKQSGQRVVILIDDCDKPILDAINNTEVAGNNLSVISDLISSLKSLDAYIHFVFVTGVAKFSLSSFYGGANQLIDISLDKKYSSLCGFTDNDLDTVFSPELEGLDRDKSREWYHGYNWFGEAVYNPFDILKLFQKRVFEPYWYEISASSSLSAFLMNKNHLLGRIENSIFDSIMMGNLEIERLDVKYLLFYLGYLTLGEHPDDPEQPVFVFPNKEVTQAFHYSLLTHLNNQKVDVDKWLNDIKHLLENLELERLQLKLTSFYAGIAPRNYPKNETSRYEGFYASIFYALFRGTGIICYLKHSFDFGRLDFLIQHGGVVFIFEFKVVETSNGLSALEQIKQKQYSEKFKSSGQPIYLIGIDFSIKKHNVVKVVWEKEF